MRRILLSVPDWLVIAAGLLLSIHTFSSLGLWPSPRGEPLFYWLAYFGLATWTVVMFSASWFCLRHRRRGAWVFSICFVVFSIVFVAIKIYDRTPYPETLYGFPLPLATLGPPLVLSLYCS